MPKWLRRYLYRGSLDRHFARALAIGFGLRLASAVFVYGPQALDDYKHGVWPAYQLYAGQSLDLPAYRSLLLTWTLSLAPRVVGWFGIDSALGQVRAMYLELALISLLAIVGAYAFARRERSRLWGRLAIYLTALYPLMPFVGTRAFGEALATAFVALGFGVLPAWPFGGFLALGVGTLYRFHVGVLFGAAALLAAWRGRWRVVGAAAAAGVVTLGAEVLIDVGAGRAPLQTLFTYLAENEGGGARYGVSPWWNPWAFVLLVSLAPLSFAFAGRVPGLFKRHGAVVWPWLIFVAAHSLVAHKEERFLYPILALELWSLAYVWAASARQPFARRVYAPVFLGVSAIGLGIACFVNSQAGEIEPPARIEARYRDVVYLDHHSLFGASRFKFYFLRAPSEMQTVEDADLTATRIDDELARAPARQAVALLTSDPEAFEKLRALAGAVTTRARCGSVARAQSAIDAALFALNPRHNQRRRPTWYLVCERS